MAPSLSKISRVGDLGTFIAEKASSLNAKEVLIAAAIVASTASLWKSITWGRRNPNWKKGLPDLHIPLAKKEKQKASIDSTFIRQVYRIMKILVPKAFSKEASFLVLIALSLMARTYCDVWMINMTTAIERTIISRETADFKSQIFKFLKAMPLIAVVNQALKYSISELKLRFRTQLTLRLQEEYLSGMTYYKMNNLDSRIANPDQLLTQDIDKFCESAVDFYSNITKPLLDVCLYVQSLISTVGIKTPMIMIGYLLVSGAFLTRLRKPVSRMTAEEQKLEGEFRYICSRIITNSEEIAFYQGHNREKRTVTESFMRLVNHLRDIISFKLSIGIIDNVIAKYFATIVGFFSVAVSFLGANERHKNMQNFEIMEEYYSTFRMVVSVAQAIGRLALAGRELNTAMGYTTRVVLLMDVLSDMKKDNYVRAQVERRNDDQDENSGSPSNQIAIDMKQKSDIIIKDHVIHFQDVPLVTPTGDVLLNKMSFEVISGRNVLVCGPNGCGKSSLFRVLGQLWPSYGGSVTKPAAGKLFYVPQRPYMTVGTLRDQIIYPDSIGNMKVKGYTDEKLKDFLDKVHLGYILDREGGWDSIQDWIDVLSGGEKQRVAMARLFYHKPQFAILDECTSAVSVDVEGFMYTHCKEVGITLFTVSHRKSLWKYHEYVLYMDGRGSYEFKPIDESTTEFGS